MMNGERFDGLAAKFLRDQTKWKIEQGILFSEATSDYDHEHYFGIKKDYTSLIPLVWSIVDNEQLRIAPPKNNAPDEEVIAWWMAAVHLLALGLGWDNLGRGINAWAIRGFPEENHILRFIKRNYGDSILALEKWSDARGERLIRELRNLSYNETSQDFFVEDIASARQFLSSDLDDLNHLFRPLEMDILNLEFDSSNPLSRVFSSGISEWTIKNWSEGEWARWQDSKLSFNFQRYEAWMSRASQSVRELADQNEDSPMSSVMSVNIEGIGFMGQFSLHGETGRWVRQGRDAESEWQDDFWHIVGVTTR
jgi:hypothetical protein